MCAASTGRTHGRTDQRCRTVQFALAKGEPSTQGEGLPLATWQLCATFQPFAQLRGTMTTVGGESDTGPVSAAGEFDPNRSLAGTNGVIGSGQVMVSSAVRTGAAHGQVLRGVDAS